MAKSSSCFPTFKCLKKKLDSNNSKLKASIRMPTLREFLHTNNNAGTQTESQFSSFPKKILYHTKSLQNSTPLTHRSTIAVRRDKSFVPLTTFDNSKEESKAVNRINSPTISILSRNSLNSTRNNTLFMSKNSFDTIFSKVESESKIIMRKMLNPFEITEERKEVLVKKNNPFVVTDRKKPKIVAITPAKWKRAPNSNRPNIKINLRPTLAIVKDTDYLYSTSTSHAYNHNFYSDTEDINQLK
ncbi:hypothetical protein SteCoe_9015 [Stentor coeruleus]|uniref:Uncharacterized protein n=1 Tax=Stentor coeruleus TaxID=5963 RepID=A0A1R2CIQ2_9CILI|nr:hypothetical protein SteCoe_9015 [Stentor coeruleus]